MNRETTFHPVNVRAVRKVADRLHEVVLDLGDTGLGPRHTVPGQFVQIRVDGTGPSFFAISSAPEGGAELELLVKEGGGVAERLVTASPGAAVEISAPQGKGFPVDAFEGSDVLLFATGSAISAIRPVVHHVVKRRERFGRVVLFFGARTPHAFAYLDEIPEWERERIEVHRVISRPGTDEVWDGPVGYVQDVLAEVSPEVGRAVALVCGVKDMHAAVSEALVSRGLPEDRVLTNF